MISSLPQEEMESSTGSNWNLSRKEIENYQSKINSLPEVEMEGINWYLILRILEKKEVLFLNQPLLALSLP